MNHSQLSQCHYSCSPVLRLEPVPLVSTPEFPESRAVNVGQSEGNGAESGPLRAMCVQGGTSENPKTVTIPTAHLSDMPC